MPIERYTSPPAPTVLGNIDRRTAREMSRIEGHTVRELAVVQSRGLVASAMSHEISHVTRDAMSNIAMLRKWGDIHAHGDPFLADDMRFFGDIAKMGMGEVIANLVDRYCDQARR